VDEPAVPPGILGPKDVYEMLGEALNRIHRVKNALGIVEQSKPPPLKAAVQPSQVFIAIVDANREVNGLLDQQFSPGDVFQQVTVAVANTARLLDSPGEISTPPDVPEFERRKRPTDVYRRLLDCFEKVCRVGEISKVPMLRIELAEEQIEKAEPSDVYDIASLLVSELTYLRRRLPVSAPPRRTYSPGRKLPSHVYQRAGILQTQLGALIARAERNPGWLGKQDEAPPPKP